MLYLMVVVLNSPIIICYFGGGGINKLVFNLRTAWRCKVGQP